MFTGIIEAIGTVQEITTSSQVVRLKIEAPALFAEAVLGESVSINGVCLTVTEVGARAARFDAVPETIRRTKLGRLRPGSRVNLERALRPTDRLGGHIVQGHVDGIGTVRSVQRTGDAVVFAIDAPPEVTGFLVEKGSVAVDGVSLTVAGVREDCFTLALIPHTLSVTTLELLQPGDIVNLEADIIGKYVARYVARQSGAARKDANLMHLLQEEGFTNL